MFYFISKVKWEFKRHFLPDVKILFLLHVCIFSYLDGEHEFLDLNEKLSKLAKFAPHLWKDDVSDSTNIYFYMFVNFFDQDKGQKKKANK